MALGKYWGPLGSRWWQPFYPTLDVGWRFMFNVRLLSFLLALVQFYEEHEFYLSLIFLSLSGELGIGLV